MWVMHSAQREHAEPSPGAALHFDMATPEYQRDHVTRRTLQSSALIARSVTAGLANAGNDVEDLDAAWQLDQELGVTLQMVDAPRIIAREP
jgi:hypothetical protein